MTRDTFFRILSLALCAVILLGCALGLVRAANHKKADAMLREYYGDALRFAGGSFYYVKEGKKNQLLQRRIQGGPKHHLSAEKCHQSARIFRA